MDFYGAYLTIIYTVLLHFNVVETSTNLLYVVDIKTKAVVSSIQGLVFISYPLIGLLADIKLTRYRMIRLSCWAIFIGHTVGIILCTIAIVSDILNYHPYNYKAKLLVVSTAVIFVLMIVGKGMFESTVIQFGTDQMIEASSAQLGTFIHWYYWSLYIGSVCINVIFIGMAQYFSQCKININHIPNKNIIVYLLILTCSIQCILCSITFLLLYLKKFNNYLNIEPVGINPVKQIIDVLKYAYHHKYPVRRSALSYYRNTYPSRLDFGKVQYGGPFTNEEVEDTKTVLRLLVLLLSLFGFHLSSDEFSVNNHVLYKSCPSSLALLYFISNPSILTDIITLVGIPVFHVLVKSSFGKYVPNMIKRMWFGMLLLFLQELVSSIIANQISYINCEYYMGIFGGPHYKLYRSPTRICYFSIIQYINNTEWNTTDCVSICPSSLYTVDSTLMWLLVPQIIHGFGYMLVFVSVLEFICAQAPFRLKGFMIGIWYAMFSLKYLLINMIDSAVIYYGLIERTWIIYESIKIGIIGLSLIIFGIICRWYCYRERDEVVNVQGMIEEIVERELLQQQNEEESTNDEDTVLISSQTNYHTFH